MNEFDSSFFGHNYNTFLKDVIRSFNHTVQSFDSILSPDFRSAFAKVVSHYLSGIAVYDFQSSGFIEKWFDFFENIKDIPVDWAYDNLEQNSDSDILNALQSGNKTLQKSALSILVFREIPFITHKFYGQPLEWYSRFDTIDSLHTLIKSSPKESIAIEFRDWLRESLYSVNTPLNLEIFKKIDQLNQPDQVEPVNAPSMKSTSLHQNLSSFSVLNSSRL